MAPRTILLSLLAATILASGCAAPGTPPSQTSAEPTIALDDSEYGVPWRVSDYWVQRVYYTQAQNDTIDTLEYFVEAVERVGTETTLRISGNEGQRVFWLRASDGALVKEREAGMDRTYDPPCAAFIEQVQAGATREHACYRFGTRPRNASLEEGKTLSTQVKETETLVVEGVGQYEVSRIETSLGGSLLLTEYYAHQACFPARVSMAEGDKTLRMDLVTYSCANI